jgi:hypothetical protein
VAVSAMVRGLCVDAILHIFMHVVIKPNTIDSTQPLRPSSFEKKLIEHSFNS